MKLRMDLRVLKGAAAALAVLLAILAGALLLQSWEKNQGQAAVPENSVPAGASSSTETAQELTYYDGAWYARREDLETVLLLGLDKYADTAKNSYLNNQQADFLLLLVLDKGAGTCTPVQLNRDTMTEIQMLGVNGKPSGSFTGQLALAHTYGSGQEDSCENTAEAVSKLLYGVPIDHYISMTMDGVSLLNDLVGGVTVEILDDFSDIDETLVQGERITLRGEQALTYVRSRGGLEDSSNLRRMERQRQYLAALQGQLAASVEADEGFMLSALLQVNSYLVSDCTVEQLSALAEFLSGAEIQDVRTLEGEAREGEEFMEFYPDEAFLQALVMDVFYAFERAG